jgi:hypothetical protein
MFGVPEPIFSQIEDTANAARIAIEGKHPK